MKNKINNTNIRKNESRIIFLFFFFTAFLFPFFNLKIRAQEMSSQNFKIQGGNFNMTSGNKASQNYKLSDVVGQTAATFFASKGYFIQSGFLNSYAGAALTFSVSPSLIDFGELKPQTPIEKTLKITISNGNAVGYSVKVAENQPLSTLAGAEIPDTFCDGGKTGNCTYRQGAPWIKRNTYGFGFRVLGKTTPPDFQKENFFRPFPATRRNEPPIIIMQSQAKKVTDQATMTLKVNISPNQPVGQYRNVLSFTALVGI